MLQKEIEKVGIPAVLVTALPPAARVLNASRIVEGVRVTNPLGDPDASSAAVERAIRRDIVERCMQALTRAVEADTRDRSQ